MELLLRLVIFIIAPFIYGYSYIQAKYKIHSEFKKEEKLVKKNFKPFWIETNQIFHEVKTPEDFLVLSLKYKKIVDYYSIPLLSLKISKYDFNIHTQKPNDKVGLISFGLRGEHCHDIDYTLEDYLKS